MLLSFAQFEREVTGERIRDKIAASKAKGIRRPPVIVRNLRDNRKEQGLIPPLNHLLPGITGNVDFRGPSR